MHDLGLANEWHGVPEIVEKCRCKQHKRESYIVNTTIRETQCSKCGYKYQFDLELHIKATEMFNYGRVLP